jgi:DNA replication protein DnaC
MLLEEIAEAALDGKRKEHMELLATVPLLIIDDLGMRKLGPAAGEELLEIVMRRYERASTLLTSNRPVEDWGKLLRCHRHARTPTTPRPHPEVRTAELENQN